MSEKGQRHMVMPTKPGPGLVMCADYQHPFNFPKTEVSVAVADGLPRSFQSLQL
jgi:hypothetical protein